MPVSIRENWLLRMAAGWPSRDATSEWTPPAVMRLLHPLRRPLLLCVGLRDHSLDAMRSIIQEVLAHPLW